MKKLIALFFVLFSVSVDAELQFKPTDFSVLELEKEGVVADIMYRFDVIYLDPDTFAKEVVASISFVDDDGMISMLIVRNAAIDLLETLEQKISEAPEREKPDRQKELFQAVANIRAFYQEMICKLMGVRHSEIKQESIAPAFKSMWEELMGVHTSAGIKQILTAKLEKAIEEFFKDPENHRAYHYDIYNAITTADVKHFFLPPRNGDGRLGSLLSKAIWSSVNNKPGDTVYIWKTLKALELTQKFNR